VQIVPEMSPNESKAVKEAKRQRTQINANTLREQALTDFAGVSDFVGLVPKADVLPIALSRNRSQQFSRRK